MRYQKKINLLGVGALAALVLFATAGDSISSGRFELETFLLVSFFGSIAVALLLALVAIVIAIVGRNREVNEPVVGADTLDAELREDAPRVLTSGARARAFLLAAGLVLLIGTSICYGGLAFGG